MRDKKKLQSLKLKNEKYKSTIEQTVSAIEKAMLRPLWISSQKKQKD
jgi:hypothetical protein